MDTTTSSSNPRRREPWNKGKLVGQKAPFKPKDIWAMRMRLQQEHRSRDLALLNIGLDSKLRACDLVSLKVRDISHGEHVASRATVQQKKTKRPVQFEITAPARDAAEAWIREAGLRSEDYLFPSRTHHSPHICTRQYARMLREW
jgi:integrase